MPANAASSEMMGGPKGSAHVRPPRQDSRARPTSAFQGRRDPAVRLRPTCKLHVAQYARGPASRSALSARLSVCVRPRRAQPARSRSARDSRPSQPLVEAVAHAGPFHGWRTCSACLCLSSSPSPRSSRRSRHISRTVSTARTTARRRPSRSATRLLDERRNPSEEGSHTSSAPSSVLNAPANTESRAGAALHPPYRRRAARCGDTALLLLLRPLVLLTPRGRTGRPSASPAVRSRACSRARPACHVPLSLGWPWTYAIVCSPKYQTFPHLSWAYQSLVFSTGLP